MATIATLAINLSNYMKAITLLFLLFACKSFAQHQLYISADGTYQDEAQIRYAYNKTRKAVPATHDVNAIIYHKVIKKDTVINYYTLGVTKRRESGLAASANFKFQFKQDSTFLFLDKKLPYFKMTDLDGKEVTSNDLVGKPTLINFWAIYCTWCIAEMPDLSKLKEKYKDKVNFLSITEDSADGGQLRNFLKDKDFNYRVLVDGKWYENQLALSTLPRNLFLDKNGILRSIQITYPMIAAGKPRSIDDKDNYFVKILDSLVNQK